ncbi:MAG: hypothetical protein AB7T05_03965 [Fimbriimonadaceae bacterium]
MHALGAGVSPLAMADWTNAPVGWPYNWQTLESMNSSPGPDHLNNGGSAVEITGSCSYWLYSRISGSANTAPPWIAMYTPVNDASTYVTREYTKSLPAGKGGHVYDKLWVSEGAQTWTESATVCTRERLVYIVGKLKFLDTWDLPPNGGGD